MGIIASLVLLALVVVNWLRFRDFLYPGFLQAALWAIIVILLNATRHLFNPISDQLFLTLIIGVLMFSEGVFLSTWQHVPVRTHNKIRPDSLPPIVLIWLFLLVVIVGSILFVKQAILLGKTGPTDNFFVNLRGALTWTGVGTRAFGISRYVGPISFIVAGCLVLRYLETRKGKFLLVFAILLALNLCIFSTGRTFFFLLLIFLLGIPLILRRIHPRVALAGFLSSGIAIFILMALLEKHVGLGQSFSSIIDQSLNHLFQYLLGPTVALDQLLQNEVRFEMGQNTLRFFYVILSSLGDNIVPPSLIQAYVFVPFPVNVYTMYGPYYLDYGVLGIILAPFLWGLWHGFLYRQATTASPKVSYVLLYALSLYPLFIQFFNDAYITCFSMWLQFFILVFLVTTVGRVIRSLSQNRSLTRGKTGEKAYV